MTAPDSPRKRRFRGLLQFRLRSLLILMTLSAVGLATYYGYALPYKRQHDAGLALAAKGASLEWRPMEPAWLAAVLRVGLDDAVLQDCVTIHGEHTQINDDDLAFLEHMPGLERLYLAGTSVTDKGMVHLSGLQRLERLSLWGTSVTDDGIRHIGQLGALRVLDIHRVATSFALGTHASQDKLLSDNPPRVVVGGRTGECLKSLTGTANLRAIYFSSAVDDEGLARLAEMRHLRLRTLVLRGLTAEGMARLPHFRDLETLVIEESAVGSDGLQYLRALPHLQWLKLRDVQAAPGGWNALGDLPRLEQLSLIGSPIDDGGMAHLARLQGLQKLTLRSGSVNDQNVGHVARLTDLRKLDLRDTLVSADALESLKNLPRLRELWFPSPFDDEAVGWLLEMKGLVEVWGPGAGTCEFYLSDAGMANLKRLFVVKSAALYDAIAGADLAGIDLGPGAGTISNEKLARLWGSPSLRSVKVTGRDVTAASLRWGPEMQNRYVRFVSPRPLSEFITRNLDCVVRVESSVRKLTLGTSGSIGPRSVTITYGTDDCPLEVLRYLPETRRLVIGAHDHEDSTGCDWDKLRFVPKLEVFQMSVGQSEQFCIDPIGLRRLGETTNLRTMTCRLSESITCDDFAVLGGLKHLQNLYLKCAELSADHMRVLGQLTNLKELRVTQATADTSGPLGVEHLANLQQLTELQLCGLTDEDMPGLARLLNLREISVKNHSISDDGFECLARLPKLRYLDVGAGWTAEQIESLAQRFAPRVRVRSR